MDDKYIEKNGERLRIGYTTGSCATAAAAAAAKALLTGEMIATSLIQTPKGPMYEAEIVDLTWKNEDAVSCAVQKDGGDDPDITTGLLIYATVRKSTKQGIIIDGGEGVGRVTKPGLDQPIGQAAINSTPRRQIAEHVQAVMDRYHYQGGMEVIISVPGGEAAAQKTFNPKLGIVGGISILGTSGIVEPMSEQALLDTMRVEMQVRHAQGEQTLILAPGNYGLDFLVKTYGMDKDRPVMISNFVYDAAKMAEAIGFTKILFCGHIGKLVKVAGGIKNTHSKYGDHRMEILLHLAKEAAPETAEELAPQLLEAVMTDEALRILGEYQIADQVCEEMVHRIRHHMEEWSGLETQVIVFSNQFGELAYSEGAHQALQQ